MNISAYQELVSKTMNFTLTREQAVSNYALGLAGETGEVIEPLKKHLYHGRSLDLANVGEELADVIWYVSALANTLGLDLASLLRLNIEKLQKRWPDGFKPNK